MPAGTMISPSTRRAVSVAASARSRSGSSSELATMVIEEWVRATSSMPRSTEAKNGLPTSVSSKPMLPEARSARRSVLAVRSRS
jgi:hypothetical protein